MVARLSSTASSRLLAACLVMSLVFHALLVLTLGTARRPDTGWRTEFRRLEVVLDGAPWNASPHEQSGPEAPARLQPARLLPMRAYPKLLKFAPMELPPAKFDEALYLPLSVLTKPPTVAGEITIAYPSDDERPTLLVAALTLFIDEDGTVAKVRAEEPRAPASYERAAIDAFWKARFNPGMVSGRAVKTRMVIRVAFDSGSIPNSSAGIRFK